MAEASRAAHAPGGQAMTAHDLASRLIAAGPTNAVEVRRAGPDESWPGERVEGDVACVVADAVVAETAAVVLFGSDRRLRPILSAATLIAHARESQLVLEFGDALLRFD